MCDCVPPAHLAGLITNNTYSQTYIHTNQCEHTQTHTHGISFAQKPDSSSLEYVAALLCYACSSPIYTVCVVFAAWAAGAG